MLNQKIVELRFTGNIPSKKNSRINTSDGRSFPSNKFTQWQNDAIIELRQQTRHRFFNPVSIEVIIYFSTDSRADLDNRLTSLLDMFVEALLLPDDKWQNIPIMKIQAEYRAKKPGAFVRIEEVGDAFFNEDLKLVRAKRKHKCLP